MTLKRAGYIDMQNFVAKTKDHLIFVGLFIKG